MSPGSNANSNGNAGGDSSSDLDLKRKGFDPADVFTKDWRNYHCTTWHLEPTVRYCILKICLLKKFIIIC